MAVSFDIQNFLSLRPFIIFAHCSGNLSLRGWAIRKAKVQGESEACNSRLLCVCSVRGYSIASDMPTLIATVWTTAHPVVPYVWQVALDVRPCDVGPQRGSSLTNEQIDQVNRQFGVHCEQVQSTLIPGRRLKRCGVDPPNPSRRNGASRWPSRDSISRGSGP